MLKLKIKGKVAILGPTRTGDEKPPKQKEKKTKAQKEARRVTRSSASIWSAKDTTGCSMSPVSAPVSATTLPRVTA